MLADGIRRTASLFRAPSVWRKIQTKGMATDVSWRRPASRYVALYRALVAHGTDEAGKERER